jgi:hypothetical protein
MHTPYKEGQFFLLPLDRGTFAVGLIARVPARGGVLLGYFFGPRRLEAPTDPTYLPQLKGEHAVFACRFKDAPLYRGEWQIIGARESFRRADWPVPAFHRYDGSGTHVPGVVVPSDWRVEYGEDNLIVPVREIAADQGDLGLVDDTAYDAASLGNEVSRRLSIDVPGGDKWSATVR